MSKRYYKDGTPIKDLMTRAKLLENDDYKRVDFTTIGGTDISTVWLWLDHRMYGEEWDNPPIIFETMIFSDNKAIDWDQWRYSTLEEAEAWHKSACEYAKKVLSSNVE